MDWQCFLDWHAWTPWSKPFRHDRFQLRQRRFCRVCRKLDYRGAGIAADAELAASNTDILAWPADWKDDELITDAN